MVANLISCTLELCCDLAMPWSSVCCVFSSYSPHMSCKNQQQHKRRAANDNHETAQMLNAAYNCSYGPLMWFIGQVNDNNASIFICMWFHMAAFYSAVSYHSEPAAWYLMTCTQRCFASICNHLPKQICCQKRSSHHYGRDTIVLQASLWAEDEYKIVAAVTCAPANFVFRHFRASMKIWSQHQQRGLKTKL